MFKISERGIDLIRKFENFEPEAYPDTGGVPTVGYGFIEIDGVPVKFGDTITLEEAEKYLLKKINYFTAIVNKHVKVPMNQNQVDAIISFVYNIGESQFEISTLLALLNQGKYDRVPNQMKLWHFDNGKSIQGLINRRAIEAELFGSLDVNYTRKN